MKTPIITLLLLVLLWSCNDDEPVGPSNPKTDETPMISFTVEALDTTVLIATHFFINFDVPIDSLPNDIKIMADNQQLSVVQQFGATWVVSIPEEKKEYGITLNYKDTTLSLGKVRTAAFNEIAPTEVGYMAINDTLFAGVYADASIQFSKNTFSYQTDSSSGTATFYENGLPELLVYDTISFYLTNYTDSTVDVYHTKQKFKYLTVYIKDFLEVVKDSEHTGGRLRNTDIALAKLAMLPFLRAVAQLAHFGQPTLPNSPHYVYLPTEAGPEATECCLYQSKSI